MSNYTQLNTAQGIIREFFGQIEAGGSLSINSSTAHDVFLVLFGAWNSSGVYLVFPNQGGTPVSVLLGKHSNNPSCSFSVNGNWGIKVNNTSTVYSQACVVYRIRKGY